MNAFNEVNYLCSWHFGYIQDDWRALPNLTINAGLRYEFMSPYYEQDNKLLNYDPVNNQLLHAGTGTDINSTTPGHIYKLHYVGGSSLADRALINPDYKDFAPRLGFAYQVRPGTVVRGAYGMATLICFASAEKVSWRTTGRTTIPRHCPSIRLPDKGCALL